MGKKKKKGVGKKHLNPVLTVALFIFLGVLFTVTTSVSKFQKASSATPKPSILGVLSKPKTSIQKTARKQVPAIPQSYGKSVNVPILYYHYIGTNGNPEDVARDNLSVAPDKFDEQMAYIAKNGYNVITLDTLYAALQGNVTLPPKPVVLSFDDGYIDFYVNAYPVLKKYGFHATSFIPTGLINQGYYLTWAQIKEMDSAGLISFQAHSVNHLNMPSLSSEQIRYEVNQSKKELEAQIGHPVNFFSYPYGASNEEAWKAVKDAGFAGAVGTWYGSIQSEGNIFDMPRIKIPGGLSITDFASKI
ncbi:polysaccharide deacetylase family protein [Candidatus Daviesbacteria bacterium]|nr:polysaccharide deacetylase family protein [Candidatus Daviesbacteria bacterium]